MKEIYFTTCQKSDQDIHGVLDWYKLRKFPKDNAIVIRARLMDTDKVVGQAVIEVVNEDDNKIGWIFYLAVHPDYRENGIGSKLVKKCTKKLKKMGVAAVSLRAQKEFEDKLIPWYKSLGFKLLGRLVNDNGNTVDEKDAEMILVKVVGKIKDPCKKETSK